MMTNREAAGAMTDILGLRWHPVAVKFVPTGRALPELEAPERRRFCQVLMEARRGEKRLLTPENVSCPAVASALGFKPLPEKLASGEMPAAFGIFASAEAGRRTIESMPRLEPGKYAAVAVLPLGEVGADCTPDVVVVEGLPEQLMWLALACVHETGGRLEFSTAVLQATCVDAAILPFLTARPNATLGCYGCREATDLGAEECVMGIPGGLLDTVVTNLRRLAAKAIPRVRAKSAYLHLGGMAQANEHGCAPSGDAQMSSCS
jgi:uncharacterized protein (DUF169 family)